MEHSEITRAERFGSRAFEEEQPIKCPVCNQECETFYKKHGEILGCDMCVDIVDVWEHQEKSIIWG